jgi:hypothetical protein
MKSRLIISSFRQYSTDSYSRLIHAIYFFIIFIISLSFCYAQQPTLEWVARYQGPSNDLFGPFLQVDKTGNSYIAGTHVINDSINILCAKYNTNGVQVWSRLYKYPGEGYFAPTGMALDSSGNAYVISGIAQTSLTPRNSLIVKFNSINGSPVWAKRYFGQYTESGFFDIKIDNQNNIYVAGGSDTNHLVIRYNTDGDSVWVRKYHPPGLRREVAHACTLDDSLNIIFTGFRRFYNPPFGHYDSLLVAKYSSNGVLRWESVYAYNPLSENRGTKITSDQNGNLYIGSGSGIPGGDWVFLTLRYDRNGTQQWVKIYNAPGSGDNNLRGIAMDRINNALFVTGDAITNGVQMATTVKYNPASGDSIWVRKDTGTYSRANSSAVKVDSSGNIYITGGTYNLGLSPFDLITRKYSGVGASAWFVTYDGPFNGIDFGIDLGLDNFRNVYVLATSESGSGVRDYIVVKYSQLSGITPISSTIPSLFKLNQNYPNPFNPSTKIKFTVPKASFIELRIYDVLGRIKEVPVNEKLHPSEYELTVDGTNYASGVYFYQLNADNNLIDTKKFIVLK